MHLSTRRMRKQTSPNSFLFFLPHLSLYSWPDFHLPQQENDAHILQLTNDKMKSKFVGRKIEGPSKLK